MAHTHHGYNAGHPWYYHLGGKRLSLKEIREDVKERGYQGYKADDILAADRLPEPRRSETLRMLRTEAMDALREDISRYRDLSRALTAYRRKASGEDIERVCADIHTNISLKHNHIYNELAHLELIDELLSYQGDLFA